jgi:drug/metabolite transporter (DMT)-like permease
MNAHSLFLYISTVTIWGSTWIAITYQLGAVDPIASVIYRMVMASVLLFLLCKFRGISLQLNFKNHQFVALQGLCLFGLNYWAIYHAELYLPSGIIAVIFSLIVFFNIINARIFLGYPFSINIIIGGIIGVLGIGLLFYPELNKLSSSNTAIKGFLFALAGAMCASLGNIAATRNGLLGISVWSINAWGTLYGTVALLIIALANNTPLTFEYSTEYILSLFYLIIFGTIIAFGAYLKLLVMIGPEKAGYTGLLIPFFALIISTLFEGYQWTILAVIGFSLVALGNFMVMKKR